LQLAACGLQLAADRQLFFTTYQPPRLHFSFLFYFYQQDFHQNLTENA